MPTTIGFYAMIGKVQPGQETAPGMNIFQTAITPFFSFDSRQEGGGIPIVDKIQALEVALTRRPRSLLPNVLMLTAIVGVSAGRLAFGCCPICIHEELPTLEEDEILEKLQQ